MPDLSSVALVCGRLDDDKFPGRNTFPLLGRAMLAYPILAARHAHLVHKVFVSTDSPVIAREASYFGANVIERLPELSGRAVPLERVVVAAYAQISNVLSRGPAYLVVLLCNAPTVTAEMIDHGIEILMEDSSLDAVVSVSQHNEFHPSYALRIAEGGLVRLYGDADETQSKFEDAYFPDALLWVIRSHILRSANRRTDTNWIIDFSAHRVFPLVHEGYGDVDHVWQVPAIEEWLRRQGFTEGATPYDVEAPQVGVCVEAFSRVREPRARGRVLITTVPFGEIDRRPLRLLEEAGIEFVINPLGRRLREEELAQMGENFEVLIAGTEPITAAVMDRSTRLRFISRVGIGLDSVDLLAARDRGILVSYTPDAPAPAVAELTVGLILSLLRGMAQADRGLRGGVWHRIVGRRLSESTIGVIGVGRVGKQLIKHLQAFSPRILANDLRPDTEFGNAHGITWVDKERIYREANIISLHLPLTPLTRNLITEQHLHLMKPDALLINTSRGGIVDEHALALALRQRRLAGAALDVFCQEPYSGELVTVDNCLLTCHMGSMTRDCRAQMELEATEEAIRFLKGEPLRQLVPEDEYANRRWDRA